jgi:zinc/manganese transport system ATP-binding protein
MRVEIHDALFGYRRRPVIGADAIVISPGRCLGIYGPNGSGKTTLLRAILGLLPPMRGRVVRDADVSPAYLPQHREMELHWPMSGLDAAALWASARSLDGHVRGPLRDAVREMMQMLGVEHLARAPFARLSGGQQQRLLLAGLLATRPNLLVLDEPTDGLDAGSTRTLLSLLRHVRDAGSSADSAGWISATSWQSSSRSSTSWLTRTIPAEPARLEVVPVGQLTRRILHAEAPTSS